MQFLHRCYELDVSIPRDCFANGESTFSSGSVDIWTVLKDQVERIEILAGWKTMEFLLEGEVNEISQIRVGFC